MAAGILLPVQGLRPVSLAARLDVRLVARLVALALGVVLGCLSESDVEQRLADANHCETAEDCVEFSPGCPLGCIRLIHESEVAEMQELVDRYHRRHRDNCVYDCVALGPIRCEGGACVADPL